VEIQLHALLTSALDGMSGQLHATAFLPQVPTWIGGYAVLRAGLDAVAETEDPCPYRESNPGRPARNSITILPELPQLPFNREYLKSRIN